MPDEKIKKAVFRIENGAVEEFAFIEDNYDASNNRFNIHSEIRFNYDSSANAVDCHSTAVVSQDSSVVLKITLMMRFGLSPDTIMALSSQSRLVLPVELLHYFASTTYGALRGALMAKIERIPINIILPAVNLNDIIREPLVIEFKEN